MYAEKGIYLRASYLTSGRVRYRPLRLVHFVTQSADRLPNVACLCMDQGTAGHESFPTANTH